MLYIEADHLTDGVYNIKDGEIFKYKANGGTVRTYKIGNIVRCKECRHWSYSDLIESHNRCERTMKLTKPDDFCSYGERKEKCKECWYWSEVHKRCENKCGCQFKLYGEMKSDEQIHRR